jgi:hypothetical protein
MSKVYIVTEGKYSDYGIEACFSTKKKAQEFVKNIKKIRDSYYYPNIEEWDLDEQSDIVDVINIFFTFTSPLSKNEHTEKIESRVDKSIRSQVYEYSNKIEFYGFDLDTLRIKEIANPNKTIEEEIARLTKAAYDTAKKINYLYKVEGIKTLAGIRKRLEE